MTSWGLKIVQIFCVTSFMNVPKSEIGIGTWCFDMLRLVSPMNLKYQNNLAKKLA